jgi:hypothetical protein
MPAAGYCHPMPLVSPASISPLRMATAMRISHLRTRCGRAALLVMATAVSWAQSIPPPATGSPPLTAPVPGIVAFAKNHQLPLTGIERQTNGAGTCIGDEVIVLITLFKAGTVDQWLGRFRVVEPTGDERQAKDTEITLYSSTGAKHVFTSAVSVIEMQLVGPFHDRAPKPDAVGEQQARMRVRSDFLALGLESWYSDVLNRNEVAHPRFLPNGYSSVPFSAEQVEKTSAIARDVGFTSAADRGAAGGELALGEFLSIAQHTPGLSEIAAEVIERPSLWSFLYVSRIGFGFHWADRTKVVSRFDAQAWGWTPMPIYRGANVLVLNGKVAAKIALFVTAPQPPLETCAGVVAFTVESPNHPDRRVEMRVLSARRGGR